MIICIIGPSGCGKGTQAELLAQELGIPAISVGELLRQEAEKGTREGIEAKKYWEKGRWVPTPLTFKIFKKRLDREDCKRGFIVDGFPRAREQIFLLEDYLAEKGQKLDVVFHLDTKEETCLARFKKRIHHLRERGERIRADDTLKAFKRRLANYKETIGPVLSDLEKKGILVHIDNEGTPEEVHQRILSHIPPSEGIRPGLP